MKKNVKKAISAMILAGVMAAFPVSAGAAMVCTDQLNVRTSPSLDGEIVDMLYYGDNVLVTYDAGDWYEIYLNGGCYYVCSSYVGDGSGSSESYDDYDESYDDYDDDLYEEDYDDYSDSTSGGTYLGNFTLTAYCNCAQCCGTAGNPTASGTMPAAGRTVAMGGVPFGTQLLINGNVYTVEDRGTPYGHVDIFFNSHSEALAFGMQSADVYQLN
ncbi:MAG: SH3 domain-containing protein [Blautia sp.]|nr:SH3 domain-containing protein [Blautia sp.]